MIIGISSKFDFGRWNHSVRVFETQQEAEKWLYTEEGDFRERELFEDVKEAVQLAGIESVASAIEGRELEEAELWKALRKAYVRNTMRGVDDNREMIELYNVIYIRKEG